EQPVCLPKMVGISLSTAMRLLLGQIKGDDHPEHHGAYSYERDHVVITTTARASNPETWIADGTSPPPTVDVECVDKPLTAALGEIRDHSGVNIVLDQRAADKARKAVTVRMTRVPVDTAVRLLADMADLRMVVMDNVLYVTSSDNAKELQAEQHKKAALQ